MNKNRILLAIFLFFLALTSGLLVYYLRFSFKTKQAALTRTEVFSPQLSTRKLSSCIIFDEEFCQRGEKVFFNDKFYGLGFRLSEGAKIYAPFEGPLGKTRFLLDEKIYEGIDVYNQPQNILDENTIRFVALVLPKLISEKIRVEKGEFVAEIKDQQIEAFPEYNVIIQLQRFNPESKFMETDIDLFKGFFNL